VGVGVQGLVGGGVPEPALHDLHALLAVDEQGGVEVPQLVEVGADRQPDGAHRGRPNPDQDLRTGQSSSGQVRGDLPGGVGAGEHRPARSRRPQRRSCYR
jgi:hypothetical protein